MLSLQEYKAVWNSQAVLTPAEKHRQTMFRRIGAHTRAVAKNSMIDVGASGNQARTKVNRRMSRAGFVLSGGKRVSKPGAAAFSRLGHLKRHIYFAADKDNVVIGPALLRGLRSKGAAEVLEKGGTEQIDIGGRRKRVKVTAQYRARPTMKLAFDKVLKKHLPALLENGIMREV
jgi:hypothetical protein